MFKRSFTSTHSNRVNHLSTQENIIRISEFHVKLCCWSIKEFNDLRNKTRSLCLHSLVKTEANVWENSRAEQWKPETFTRLWRHWEHVLFFFIKLLLSDLKRERRYKKRICIDLVLSWNWKFSQLGASKSYCSRYFRSSGWSYENALADQSKLTYYQNYKL